MGAFASRREIAAGAWAARKAVAKVGHGTAWEVLNQRLAGGDTSSLSSRPAVVGLAALDLSR